MAALGMGPGRSAAPQQPALATPASTPIRSAPIPLRTAVTPPVPSHLAAHATPSGSLSGAVKWRSSAASTPQPADASRGTSSPRLPLESAATANLLHDQIAVLLQENVRQASVLEHTVSLLHAERQARCDAEEAVGVLLDQQQQQWQHVPAADVVVAHAWAQDTLLETLAVTRLGLEEAEADARGAVARLYVRATEAAWRGLLQRVWLESRAALGGMLARRIAACSVDRWLTQRERSADAASQQGQRTPTHHHERSGAAALGDVEHRDGAAAAVTELEEAVSSLQWELRFAVAECEADRREALEAAECAAWATRISGPHRDALTRECTLVLQAALRSQDLEISQLRAALRERHQASSTTTPPRHADDLPPLGPSARRVLQSPAPDEEKADGDGDSDAVRDIDTYSDDDGGGTASPQRPAFERSDASTRSPRRSSAVAAAADAVVVPSPSASPREDAAAMSRPELLALALQLIDENQRLTAAVLELRGDTEPASDGAAIGDGAGTLAEPAAAPDSDGAAVDWAAEGTTHSAEELAEPDSAPTAGDGATPCTRVPARLDDASDVDDAGDCEPEHALGPPPVPLP